MASWMWGWYEWVPREKAIRLIEGFGTASRDPGGSNPFVTLCVPAGTEDDWVKWLENEQDTSIIRYAERSPVYRTQSDRWEGRD
jgi:hypothetical protein